MSDDDRPDEPIVARIDRLADGRGLVRCGKCGSSLGAYIINFDHPTWLVARGYTRAANGIGRNFPGYWEGVLRPTKHYREQLRRSRRQATMGLATPVEQARLKDGRFSRRGDPMVGRDWDPAAERVLIDPPEDPEFVRSDSDRLPQKIECARCTVVNLVTAELR